MPVDLSIKQVPDDVAERLRQRAKRHHRSLQGELRAILDAVAIEMASTSAPVFYWDAHFDWLSRQPVLDSNPVDVLRKLERR